MKVKKVVLLITMILTFVVNSFSKSEFKKRNEIYGFNSLATINNVIEVITKESIYGNTLGQNAKAEILALLEESNTDNFEINLTFLQGLETVQYNQKKDEGYYYEVDWYTPIYEVLVLDDNKDQILNKTYGKNRKSIDFGKENIYTNISNLSSDWRKKRKEFYRLEEQKDNTVNQFIQELRVLLSSKEPIKNIEIEERIEDDMPQDDDLNEIVVDEEESIPTIIEHSKLDDKDSTFIVKDLRDLRDHNMIVSLGTGFGNLKDYPLGQPVIGGSIDRYSFDNIFGVDWFFLGGWIGYGKYKYNEFSIEADITEIYITSRYGVSLTRILQDAGKLDKVTNQVDIYALIQFGYSIVNASDFLFITDSGTNAGIALGARYNWKKMGAFVEVIKTETGFAKGGIFLKL